MLHLIFKSPIDPAIFERMAPGDSVVFLENAVLGILNKDILSALLIEHSASKHFFILLEDMAVRGIEAASVMRELKPINYSNLVDLTVEHTPIQSWC